MTVNSNIDFGSFVCSNDSPFMLIAGPCLMESRDHALEMAHAIKEITDDVGIPFVYKTSFDKANRTSISSERGMGLDRALRILQEIKDKYKCHVTTDVHTAEQCTEAASVADILQIPAFLCRQTDLLIAAAETGRVVNVKKGQFLAPHDVKPIVKKLESAGCKNMMLTERGVSFGYNYLVSDMRALPIMAQASNVPIIFDATHSVQMPGGNGATSGGQREFVPYLACAAAAVGVSGIFMEVHQDPDAAPSDGPNMLHLSELRSLLIKLKLHDQITKGT